MNGILEEIVARLDRIEQAIKPPEIKNTLSVTPAPAASNGEDEVEPPKRGRGRPRNEDREVLTQEQIKTKLKTVLEKKGRSTAMAILEEFDAEKIGEIDKDQYTAFSKACDKALATDDADDLDLD
jgi:hypothetical protein